MINNFLGPLWVVGPWHFPNSPTPLYGPCSCEPVIFSVLKEIIKFKSNAESLESESGIFLDFVKWDPHSLIIIVKPGKAQCCLDCVLRNNDPVGVYSLRVWAPQLAITFVPTTMASVLIYWATTFPPTHTNVPSHFLTWDIRDFFLFWSGFFEVQNTSK